MNTQQGLIIQFKAYLKIFTLILYNMVEALLPPINWDSIVVRKQMELR